MSIINFAVYIKPKYKPKYKPVRPKERIFGEKGKKIAHTICHILFHAGNMLYIVNS